jgi:hypothetical protein
MNLGLIRHDHVIILVIAWPVGPSIISLVAMQSLSLKVFFYQVSYSIPGDNIFAPTIHFPARLFHAGSCQKYMSTKKCYSIMTYSNMNFFVRTYFFFLSSRVPKNHDTKSRAVTDSLHGIVGPYILLCLTYMFIALVHFIQLYCLTRY